MFIKIGEKIKLLRQKADVTQDRLSAYLGVTAQAISRWESNKCYPDIELLPLLADFFDITLDELLCVENSKKAKQISKYINEGEQLIELGKFKEASELYRKAVAEFPSNYNLQLELAAAIGCYNEDNLNKELANEVITICNRLLEDCTDDEIRRNAMSIMCSVYIRQLDDEKKALEIVEKMPRMIYSREVEKATLFKGDIAFVQSQECIELFTDQIFIFMRNISTCDEISTSNYTIEEKIEVITKSIKLLELIFDGDYNFYHYRLAEAYRRLVWLNIIKKDYEEALINLELTAEHTIKYDLRPDEAMYSSVMLNKIKYTKNEFHELKEHTSSYRVIEILNNEIYNAIRDTESFKETIERLKEYVK